MRYKFRAWDNVADEMLYAGEDTDVIFVLGSAGIECTDVRNGSPSGDGIDSMDHLIYMQWTGLTDRNGKEIYEGDVGEGEHAVYLIQWDEEQAQYKAKIIQTKSVLTKHCTFPLWQYVEANGQCRFEVIGNQFQHPELINS